MEFISSILPPFLFNLTTVSYSIIFFNRCDPYRVSTCFFWEGLVVPVEITGVSGDNGYVCGWKNTYDGWQKVCIVYPAIAPMDKKGRQKIDLNCRLVYLNQHVTGKLSTGNPGFMLSDHRRPWQDMRFIYRELFCDLNTGPMRNHFSHLSEFV